MLISFREYLDAARSDLTSRMQKHVKHHNTMKALQDAFPGEELDKAKNAIYTGKWRGKDERHSVKKFVDDEDEEKWGQLWSKFAADASKKRG